MGLKLCTFYADCNHTMNLMVANVPMASYCDIDANSNAVINKENCDSFKKYLIFVAGVHDCIILHELKNVQSTKDFDEDNAVRPMSYEVIRRPGQYISGMKLSHDHRLVFCYSEKMYAFYMFLLMHQHRKLQIYVYVQIEDPGKTVIQI